MNKIVIRGKYLYLLLEVLEELRGEAIGMTNANERLRPIDEIHKTLRRHNINGATIGEYLFVRSTEYELVRLLKKVFEGNPALMELDLDVLPAFVRLRHVVSFDALFLFFLSPAFKEEDFLLPAGATP